MTFNRILTRRFCLSVGMSLAVAGVLLAHRYRRPLDADGPGVVYVYFPSLCAKPGDPSDCREIPRAARPSFESMAACSAHADAELRLENNPRIMASCMRQREG
jgi:hypothetical protein